MKKLLAVLLCLLLAAAPVAMAEGYDLKISNINANIMDTEFALENIELVFGVGSNDEGAGLHIAIKANGDTVSDVVLAANSEKILAYADGISDVYSVDLQTILDALSSAMESSGFNPEAAAAQASEMGAMWAEAGEKIAGILSGAVKADGECEIDGETAAKYTIFVSEDDMQAVLCEANERIGELLEMAGQSEAAQQLGDLINGNERLSVNGTFLLGETKFTGEFSLNARNTETNEASALVSTVDGNQIEEDGVNVSSVHSELSIDTDGEIEKVSESDVTTYTVDGKFAGVVISAAPAGEEPVLISFQLPAIQAEGITEFYMTRSDAALDIQIDDAVCKMILSSLDEYMSLTYTAIDESTVNIVFESNIAEAPAYVSLDATIEQTDAEWLKTEADETVDVLTISEEQVQKLQNEAILKVLGTLGTLAGSCEALAALMTGMM